MAIDPIIFQFNVPEPPDGRFSKLLHFLHLPKFSLRSTKMITAVSAIVISLSMVSFTAFSFLSNDKSFQQEHGLGIKEAIQPAQATGTEKSDVSLPGGGVATGVGGTTGTNSPFVTMTAEPASVVVGGTATLKWSVTNDPISCTASDDWSGTKSINGTETTGALTKVQTYLFTLTCKTATGTVFYTVPVQATAQGGTGTIATRPTVALAASPSAIYTGDNSTLTWSVTNNPTSCKATGDWSGIKSTAGPSSTGVLSTAKTYSYTLTCSNSAGTGYATATVLVSNPPPNLPIVTISSNPVGPVTPGTPVALSWSATNNPTSCVASGDWSGAKAASGTQSSGPLNTIRTYNYTINCSNSAGSTVDTAAIQVLPNAPAVSLVVSPASITTGNSATITWSATNNPTSCTASGDWSGAKGASGTQTTGTLNTARIYSYSLSCTNAGGTGFTNNVKLTVALPPAPVVSINANPISITSGSSSTLSWSATNSPTSCTASGDWSGAKAASSTQSTGVLATVRTYSYTIACSNAGGSSTDTTTVNVSSGGGGVVAPVVSISVSPTSIGTGSSATLSWSATNNPTACTASNAWTGSKSASGSSSTGVKATAGTFTYTLTCSNTAGSGSASASLTVIAIPVVSISVSPASINTGSSATVTWSATNTPSSCTAGGSWTGSKAASGSQTTGVMATAGSYNYSLSCTNSGGTASASATLTVANAAPVYCSGNTPCYGPNDLASHAAPGNCWGWNLTWVINITSYRPAHPGGIRSGSTSTIENASAICNHNINAVLAGSASIPGYQDSGGSSTHSHNASTRNNSVGSALTAYRVGYYDATKP
ncbi:hypothetical protein H7Y40_02715 [Pedobacter sp.]|nr:hypothetical protein [Candidatus Saccharibacteria bacterium]